MEPKIAPRIATFTTVADVTRTVPITVPITATIYISAVGAISASAA